MFSSVVTANVCKLFKLYMLIFVNHNFIKFFVHVWFQIRKGVIFILRSGLFQRIEKCCGPFCELLLSIA